MSTVAINATATLLMVALVPCAVGAPPTDMEPVPSLPSKWALLTIVSAGECPNISGKYAVLPEAFEITREKPAGEFRDGKRTDFLVFRRLNRDLGLGTKNMRVLKKPIPPDRLFFEVRQDSPERFEFLSHSYDGKKQAVVIFEQTLGDFACDGGYLEYPKYLSQIHADGRNSEIKLYRRISRLTDGSVLVYEQHYVWSREALIFTKEATRHTYFRFSPLERQ